ncbi:MAG: hypothetical protein ACWA5U_07815 [bacterium]
MKMMKTQLLSIILLGSISGTSASAIKQAPAESKSIIPQSHTTLIAERFLRFANKSITAATTDAKQGLAHHDLSPKPQPSGTQYHLLKKKLYRAAGPSHRFRRLVNAPITGGSLDNKDSEKPAISNSKTEVTLKAIMPQGFNAKDVTWLITAKEGNFAKKVTGSGSKVKLLKGSYTVEMKVDKYKVSETLTVKGQPTKNFKVEMKAGKLKASASFSGGIKEKVRFNVYSIENGKATKKVHTVSSALQINQALPPGDYKVEVKSKSGKESSKKRVSVNPGKTTNVKLTLEANKVTLMATKDDQPFMGKAKWEITSQIDKNKVLMTANRHTAQVMLPAGPYIAKMKTPDGDWKLEKFTVTPGEKKQVKVDINQ